MTSSFLKPLIGRVGAMVREGPPRTAGKHRCLNPPRHLKSVKYVVNVVFYGRDAERKAACDFFVRQSLIDELHDLLLPASQQIGLCRTAQRDLAYMSKKAADHGGRACRLALGDP